VCGNGGTMVEATEMTLEAVAAEALKVQGGGNVGCGEDDEGD
jgi:hypothetical protein